jgi:hypothetical protein
VVITRCDRGPATSPAESLAKYLEFGGRDIPPGAHKTPFLDAVRLAPFHRPLMLLSSTKLLKNCSGLPAGVGLAGGRTVEALFPKTLLGQGRVFGCADWPVVREANCSLQSELGRVFWDWPPA